MQGIILAIKVEELKPKKQKLKKLKIVIERLYPVEFSNIVLEDFLLYQ